VRNVPSHGTGYQPLITLNVIFMTGPPFFDQLRLLKLEPIHFFFYSTMIALLPAFGRDRKNVCR